MRSHQVPRVFPKRYINDRETLSGNCLTGQLIAEGFAMQASLAPPAACRTQHACTYRPHSNMPSNLPIRQHPRAPRRAALANPRPDARRSRMGATSAPHMEASCRRGPPCSERRALVSSAPTVPSIAKSFHNAGRVPRQRTADRWRNACRLACPEYAYNMHAVREYLALSPAGTRRLRPSGPTVRRRPSPQCIGAAAAARPQRSPARRQTYCQRA